ncbi:MAG TPA: radical SAM protein [Thermoplasmata archaeon]|nr:radical SAM protein [Thermoplasmata archaeon]
MSLCGTDYSVGLVRQMYHESRQENAMVTMPSKLQKGLPRRTGSLCPECLKIIPATLYIGDGALMMKKTCKEHGEFQEVCWSDAELYLKAENWAFDGVGIANPQIPDAKVCPYECGLCNLHYSNTALCNIDLTNRCNLKCPICFANANAAGYVFEPTYEQIVYEFAVLRAQRPIPVAAIQFAGGEPTIYPQFHEVVRAAKEMGFAQIQVATNGIKFATEEGFLERSMEAGLHTIYLQFDGLKEENYIKARGRPLMDVKLRVIEKVRQMPPGKRPSIVLVPTMVNSFNDDQAGEILNFAIKNSDVIKGVNYQPVSLTGRIPDEDRRKLRYTLADLAYDLEQQTGYLGRDDWYPVPFVAPISELVSALTGTAKPAFTSHPACGLASYLFLEPGKDPIPITRFVDVEGLMEDMWKLAQETKDKKIKFTSKLKALNLLRKHFKEENAPEGMGLGKFLKILNAMFTKGDKSGVSEFSWSTMYVGGMHFQDNYNYDIERVKRCVIHYATPDGKVIPFCAYNTGPNFREEVEKKFAVPIEEWRKRHA